MILPFSKIKTLNYDFFFLKTSLQLQFRKWLPSLLLLIFFLKVMVAFFMLLYYSYK